MQSKKRAVKSKPARLLEQDVVEILVANGRSVEPFVKTFRYEGENVSKSGLGTLVGVFEVAERTEDSAYVVNFLASVARKEYFANPKRGAIESFEAALHKINLALAELVKHGNTDWLGKLQGAIGIIEKNNLHFSVTGEARILLVRENVLSDISDGLASEESSLHPMKTFVEVASGGLEAEDRLILATPELLALFDPETLQKNALRLGDRFPQFLKTALVNELDMAGVLLVTFREGENLMVPVPSREPAVETKNASTLTNVFSEQAFVAPAEKVLEETPTVPLPTSEYVDAKTGHIYVQGESAAPDTTHPLWQQVRWRFEDLRNSLDRLLVSQKRFFKKARKQSVILTDHMREAGMVGGRKAWRWGRRLLTKNRVGLTEGTQENPNPVAAPTTYRTPLRPATPPPPREPETAAADANQAAPETPPSPAPTPSRLEAWFHQSGSVPAPDEPDPSEPEPIELHAPIPVAPRLPAEPAGLERLKRRALKKVNKVFRRLALGLKSVGQRIGSPLHRDSGGWRRWLEQTRRVWERFPARLRSPFAIGLMVLLALALFFLIRYIASEERPGPGGGIVETILTPTAIPAAERNARSVESTTLLAERSEVLIEPVMLAETLYLITRAGILSVSDQAFYPLPNAQQAREGAAMDDLSLIFVATADNRLYSWSPITRSYTENTVSLPEGALIQDMGAYLTYLYILDPVRDQIYRFPRATGGFGTPTLWLRDPVSLEESARLGVNESLYVAPHTGTLETYFQGRKVRTLEMPATPLVLSKLFTKPGNTRVYGLDRENKRVLIWDIEGTLVAQLFSDEFTDATSLAANAENSELYVTTEHQLFSIRLNQ